jgi:hypothetical protein
MRGAIPEPFIPSFLIVTFNTPYTHSLLVKSDMDHPGELPETGHSKRTAVPGFLLLAAALCFFMVPVAAHAPSNITIGYNPDVHQLSVTITHPVDDRMTHYIRWVQVRVNGNVISDPDYKSQPGRNSFTYTYDVMANPGDTVWVTATCVYGQSLETHYDIVKPVSPTLIVHTLSPATVTPPPATTTAPPTARTTFADTGLLPVFGAVVVVLMMRK